MPTIGTPLSPHATRVLLEGRRAVGVAYRQDGRELELRATREVLLSAGALLSPQLLMLSGIGPAEPLREQGPQRPSTDSLAQVGDLAGGNAGQAIAEPCHLLRRHADPRRGVAGARPQPALPIRDHGRGFGLRQR